MATDAAPLSSSAASRRVVVLDNIAIYSSQGISGDTFGAPVALLAATRRRTLEAVGNSGGVLERGRVDEVGAVEQRLDVEQDQHLVVERADAGMKRVSTAAPNSGVARTCSSASGTTSDTLSTTMPTTRFSTLSTIITVKLS